MNSKAMTHTICNTARRTEINLVLADKIKPKTHDYEFLLKNKSSSSVEICESIKELAF
jgi:hypothetical protein